MKYCQWPYILWLTAIGSQPQFPASLHGIGVALDQVIHAIERQLERHEARLRETYLYEHKWAALDHSNQTMRCSRCLVRLVQ
jgi:hypothetical protein